MSNSAPSSNDNKIEAYASVDVELLYPAVVPLSALTYNAPPFSTSVVLFAAVPMNHLFVLLSDSVITIGVVSSVSNVAEKGIP